MKTHYTYFAHVFHSLSLKKKNHKNLNSNIHSILPFLVEFFHTFKRLNKLKNLIPLTVKNQLPSKRKNYCFNFTGQVQLSSKQSAHLISQVVYLDDEYLSIQQVINLSGKINALYRC